MNHTDGTSRPFGAVVLSTAARCRELRKQCRDAGCAATVTSDPYAAAVMLLTGGCGRLIVDLVGSVAGREGLMAMAAGYGIPVLGLGASVGDPAEWAGPGRESDQAAGAHRPAESRDRPANAAKGREAAPGDVLSEAELAALLKRVP